MNGFVKNIESLAIKNVDFRQYSTRQRIANL